MATPRSGPRSLDRREQGLDAVDRLVQAGLADAPGLDERDDRRDRMLDDGLVVDMLVGEKGRCDPVLTRKGARLTGAVVWGDGGGLQVVADDDARPADIAAEQPAHG